MRVASWLIVLAIARLCAQGDAAFFEKKIRPVLAGKCWNCHSTKAKISFAGLQLDTRAGFLKGSDAGPVVVAGKPEESRLLRALLHEEGAKMPPEGKLPAEVIADFRAWIAGGAAWPEDGAAGPAAVKKTTDHWAWKAVTRPSIPAVRDEKWSRDAIDRFVLAKLEEKGLRPVADAADWAWLRRVAFDLTGLPPAEDIREAFAKDRSREAVIDRMLDSPAFGQRWGRHWLDQTYYADNIEIGRRVPARHAWRYRDYVIESMNRDVPYPRFVLEQVAGDQAAWTTPEERRRNLVATGFLALGPWPLVNADKEQLRMDVVDLQVDMVGRTFLGLTMGCARCHDHKFDPISLQDYYGMAGIFASTKTLDGRLGLGVFSAVHAVTLPELPEELTARSTETREYWQKVAAAREQLDALRAKRKPLEKDSADAKALDKEIAAADTAVKLLLYLPVVPPTAHAVQDAETPADCAINIRGNAHQLGKVTPRTGVAIGGPGYRFDVPDYTSGRKELAEWIGNKENPLTARVMVNRVWHHLFGAGIFPTIDNLGTRGVAPSHPELLDYLASEYVDGGWSLKKLIRRIVLTRSYGLSGARDDRAAEIDPENRLLWRMNRRRLEAETIRDAMLAVSGQLDAAVGGPALPFFVKGNMSLGEPESFVEDVKLDPALRLRRTVYLPVLRKSQAPELDLLNLFNFPDTNQITGARQATTVPTQALYLMNAPFVQEQAGALAKLIQGGAETDAARVRMLIRRVFSREARAGEPEQYLEFVQANGGGETGWARLCHTLLISNEFLYRS